MSGSEGPSSSFSIQVIRRSTSLWKSGLRRIWKCVAVGQRLKRIGQLVDPGHFGTADEHGNDGDLAFQGGFEFQRTKSAGFSSRTRPLRSVVVSQPGPITARTGC